MQPKVSVILPIYNQEKYLAKALKSLQNQTLKESEFICINDGSRDSSLKILQDFATKDPRIKIINQKNQGSGCARNNGLKIAQGEYIAFLDPDDWFEPEALESLYNKSKQQNCDLVVFNFNNIEENGNIIGRFSLQDILHKIYNIKENENFNWRNIKPHILGGMYPASWNKFYKSELIKNNKLHFANCSLAEDNAFVFGASLNAKNIGYDSNPYYNYLIHANSAIRSKSDKNFCLFKSIDCVKKLISNLGLEEELKNEFDRYIVRFVSFHIKQIFSVTKFKELCQKKFTPLQNQMLNERYKVHSKLLPMLESLIRK